MSALRADEPSKDAASKNFDTACNECIPTSPIGGTNWNERQVREISRIEDKTHAAEVARWPSRVPCTASTRIVHVDGCDRVLLRLERNDASCELFVDALPLSDDEQRLAGALMALGRILAWRGWTAYDVELAARCDRAAAAEIVDAIRDVQSTVRNTASLDDLQRLVVEVART